MTPEALLYTLTLHGQGWHVEQRPDTDAEDGWVLARELSSTSALAEADRESAELMVSSMAEVVTAALSAMRRLDAQALHQVLLHPRPLFSPAAWLRAAGQMSGLYGVAFATQRLHGERPEWQLALSAGSETLALWRHEELCLLSPRDNYAQPVALWRSPPDAAPHHRRLVWNADSTLLAGCSSTGVVHVLDARARLLYTLPPRAWMQETEAAMALAAAEVVEGEGRSTGGYEGHKAGCPAIVDLAWRERAGDKGIASELLLLCADAVVRRLTIPSAASATVHGARPAPSHAGKLKVGGQHQLVTCLAFDQASGMLAIGGGGGVLSPQARLLLAKLPPDAAVAHLLPSVSLWALFDDPPHATLLFSSTSTVERDVTRESGGAGTWVRLLPPPVRRAWKLALASSLGHGMPLSLSFALGGVRLAVLTVRGELTIWKTDHVVRQMEQARAPLDDIGESSSSGGSGAGLSTMGIPEPPLSFCDGHAGSPDQWMSVEWWDSNSLILTTRSGAVSVCALPDLANLLGAQPERFASLPAISAAHAGRFFILERELHFRQPRFLSAASSATMSESSSGGSSVVSVAAGSRGDRWSGEEVPRRLQSWRLLSLRQTSPMQLFLRKVRAPVPQSSSPTRKLVPQSSPLLAWLSWVLVSTLLAACRTGGAQRVRRRPALGKFVWHEHRSCAPGTVGGKRGFSPLDCRLSRQSALVTVGAR